jgi:hypothetical protein
MKFLVSILICLLSLQAQATCLCNCELTTRSMCASTYDIEHPCGGLCPSSAATLQAATHTACPVVKIYNQFKGIQEWHVICPDSSTILFTP